MVLVIEGTTLISPGGAGRLLWGKQTHERGNGKCKAQELVAFVYVGLM